MPLNIGQLFGTLSLDSASFTAGITAAQRSLDLTADSADLAGAAVGKAETALVGAGREANVAATGSAKLQQAQLRLVAAQERYNALLTDADVSTGRLASAEATLIAAQERLKAAQPFTPATVAAIEDESTAVGTLSARFGESALSLGKMGLGFAAFGAAFEAVDMVKKAADFQKSMLLVQTQAGASASDVKQLTSAVLAMSGSVATAPEELATSLYHAKSVGLDNADALDAVRIAAEGAKVGNADLEETTNALTATVAAGTSGLTNISQAMGALNTIVGAGDMKLSDLNSALSTGILITAKTFGVNLNQVGAALATFGDENIRGANAATTLRVAITSMAKPVVGGAATLANLGLASDQLAKDMQTGGLNKALSDLNTHLTASGISGANVGAVLTDAFGKKAGPGISILIDQLSRFQTKLTDINSGAANFSAEWTATTQNAAFQFDRLKISAEAAGISIFEKVAPVVSSVAYDLGTILPTAVGVVEAALKPLGAAFAVGALALEGVGSAAATVANVLHDMLPVIGPIGSAVTTMWLAWSGYKVVWAAVGAVQLAMDTLGASIGKGVTALQLYGTRLEATLMGGATDAQLAAMMQEQAFADVAAAVLAETAAIDKAAAIQASAYADIVAASSAATDAEVTAAVEAAAAANAQAVASQIAAAEISAAADEAAADVAGAGDVAALGWAGIAGPIGIAVLGVGALVTAFHKSSDASKQSAQAAQAQEQQIEQLTDAIKDDTGVIGDNTKAYVANQLQKSGVLDAAKQVGLSLSTVEDAALGNSDAIATVNSALTQFSSQSNLVYNANGKVNTSAGATAAAWQKVQDALGLTNSQLNAAVTAYNNVNAAQGASTAAAPAATAATTDLTTALQKVVAEEQNDTTVLNTLTTAILGVGEAQLSAAQTQDQFLDSVDAVTKAIATNGLTLDDNTAAGRANREAVESSLQSAQSYATAQQKAGAGIGTVTKTLEGNVQQLENQAISAGLSKTQVNELITQMGLTPRQIATTFSVNIQQAFAQLDTLQSKLDLVNQALQAGDIADYLNLSTKVGFSGSVSAADPSGAGRAPATPAKKAHATGGLLDPGWNLVGERTPELVNGTTHQVISNAMNPPAGSSKMPSLDGARIVIDAGSIGTLTGYIDGRADGRVAVNNTELYNQLVYS